MKRDIIEIDESLCNGCGECVPGCKEGALQIIDGKARVISDFMCDGLGACVGHCPTGALKVVKKEAEPYNEYKVMDNIVKGGENVIRAHLEHLLDHGEEEFYTQALEYLKQNGYEIPVIESEPVASAGCPSGGCPGSASMIFEKAAEKVGPTSAANTNAGSPNSSETPRSELTHWPVQLHLISPNASQFRNADMLLAADCTAFSVGNFHDRFLKGKALAIACPKLDNSQQIYTEKLITLINEAKINTLTVLIMEVPCCGGLTDIARTAAEKASRKVPVKRTVISVQGEILSEEWV